MIPITSVQFGQAEEDLVVEVLRSGMIAQGPKVAQLEREFAEHFGARHAVAVNNGTTALIAALHVLDLQPGDEVITSPFTFVATLNAILQSGATAMFADVRSEDFNVDPVALAAQITDRTRVLLPVHLYGQTADMGPIAELARKHDLRILEDAAQAQGATYRQQFAGTFGLATFSLYATKNMTTGEGGIITTDDDELADRLRLLRNQGMRARYQYEMAGNNYRLTDLQAAVGIPQLARYADTVERRRSNARRLSAGLEDVAGIEIPRELDDRGHVWHQYTIRVTESAGISRDELAAKLSERGVGSGVYYPKLVFDYEAYADHPQIRRSEVPVAEQLTHQVLSLPVHAALETADLDAIVRAVTEIVEATR